MITFATDMIEEKKSTLVEFFHLSAFMLFMSGCLFFSICCNILKFETMPCNSKLNTGERKKLHNFFNTLQHPYTFV